MRCEALDLLKNRYGNPQRVIAAYIKELLEIKKNVTDKDFAGLRKFYDNIEIHVRSLRSSGIDYYQRRI